MNWEEARSNISRQRELQLYEQLERIINERELYKAKVLDAADAIRKAINSEDPKNILRPVLERLKFK